MCESFDISWRFVLGFILFLSIAILVLRVRFSSDNVNGERVVPPQWYFALLFWGSGGVALTMILLMALGFVCAGSPGDIKGIIPN